MKSGGRRTTAHLLQGLIETTDCYAYEILNRLGISRDAVFSCVKCEKSLCNYASVSEEYLSVEKEAEKIALQAGYISLGTQHMLLALVKNRLSKGAKILAENGVTYELLAPIVTSMNSNSVGKEFSHKKPNETSLEKLLKQVSDTESDGVLIDMSSCVQTSDLVGREKEIASLIEVLSMKNKSNAILLGTAGVGKSTLVEGLNAKIMRGEVPYSLKNKKLYSLDLGALIAGTKFRGEYEERIKKLIEKIKGSIVFIDEIHLLTTLGGVEQGATLINLLKPYLARGEISVIGATTREEYAKTIEKDSAFARRFRIIDVEEPNKEKSLEILKKIKGDFEAHHGIIIEEEALTASVELSAKYVKDRAFPDKAIDLIDEGASRACLRKEEVLNEEIIREILAEKTKNPLILRKNIAFNEDVEQKLKSRIVGQDEAIDRVLSVLNRARTGLNGVARPMGSFLFIGESGVGKTALAKAIAEVVFGSEKKLIRIDMGEYKDKGSVSGLIGTTAGYIGYGEEGVLTGGVRKEPYSVVLFDEIEKAHCEVLDVLLSLLDEARLTDGMGRMVDFSATIIVMTSNVTIGENKGGARIGFSTCDNQEKQPIKDCEIRKNLNKYFREEFVNRIDEVVLFNDLSEKALNMIVEKEFSALTERLKEISINPLFTNELKSFIIEAGKGKRGGAREIKRLVRTHVENALCSEILSGRLTNGDDVTIDFREEIQLYIN